MKRLLLFGLMALCLTACHKNTRTRFRDIDAQMQVQPLHIARFDADLIEIDSQKVADGVQKLYANYPDFMPLWVENILGVDSSDTLVVMQNIADFQANSEFRKVNADVLNIFDNVADIETEIAKAFARLQVFYPDAKMPQIYFYVSGFNRAIMFNDTLIAIGTDMYLGEKYPMYDEVAYKYQHYGMRRECVAADVVSAYLFSHFPINTNGGRLMDQMLYRGRLMYLLSVLMPEEQPNEIMGYKPEQWKWCEENERAIWETLLDNKDLFSTESLTATKYLNDAPFTQPISQQSPGRLGTWLGWRIVECYMENNTDVSMNDLMAERNSQIILERSQYKP